MSLTYEDKIKLLAEKYFSTPKEPVMFLALGLGCRYVSQSQGSWCLSEADLPQPEHYPLVRASLLRLVKHFRDSDTRDYVDAFALLDGLANHEAWRIFLGEREDVQTLAYFLIYLTCWLDELSAKSEYFIVLSGQTYPAICGILNAWLLPPDGPFEAPPPLWKLAQMLFGEHWCEMFINDRDETNPWVVFNLVAEFRPAVRPDLLPAHLATQPLPLPAL
jgi:hypothetical protein